MNNTEKILLLGRKVSKGAKWCGFTYTKSDGTVSTRNLLLNVEIPSAQIRRNNPLKGKKNWLSNFACGPNGFLIERNGTTYLRGYERGGEVPKVFALDRISNLK